MDLSKLTPEELKELADMKGWIEEDD